MKPERRYSSHRAEFWAFVRAVSQSEGYSDRKTGGMKRFSGADLAHTKTRFSIRSEMEDALLDYLNFRADAIEEMVLPNLMDIQQAARAYESVSKGRKFSCSLPYNKATGKKKHLNYFTCLVNALTEVTLGPSTFDSNPQELCTLTDSKGNLAFVLARRMDGAYPSPRNPVAVWEVKEYYDNTSFGSRIADAIYETQLDGMEIKEARARAGCDISHYLFIDGRSTWWNLGRSYLCRILDLLHMGLVDEVLFGRETISMWPQIIQSWPGIHHVSKSRS